MEIDERFYGNNPKDIIDKESIYILQYSDIKNIRASFGIINDIKNNSEFNYFRCENMKDSLILNLSSKEIIGLMKDFFWNQ